ncbi:PAS domain S-box protein [Ancylothrix sp. C2]|uniref:PAS domain S-box protein n=1 Tax=Ancylothrix sp. D3o TaxID=2953691 RepID=UPI0021BA69AA|nr:PAS domain S-box protein [Ancylothrix sp. D3o]MCT7950388.1 PAS domain S-box protein [Ancylothrix sp. D3o]
MKSLAQLNNRQKSVLANAQLGWWEWDVSSEKLAWFENIEPLFGIAEGSFAVNTQSLLELVHPEDRLVFRQMLAGLAQWEIEFRVCLPDGRVRWLASRGHCLSNENGMRVSAGLCWEISKSKQAEASYKEERDLLAAILDTAGALVVVLDRCGRIVRFNRACLTMTGYPARKLEGEMFWQVFLAPEDVPDWLQRWHLAHEEKIDGPLHFPYPNFGQHPEVSPSYGGFPKEQESDCITRYGNRRRIAWTNTGLLNKDGSLKYLIATGIDITHRVEAEAAQNKMIASLKESQQRFRATFEQAAVGIAHCGLDRSFLRINKRFCEIVGYSAEEVQLLTFADIILPEDLDADLEQRQLLIENQISTYSIEKRCRRKDGSVVWVNLTVALVRECLESKQPKYFIIVVEDISKRKKAEAELAKAKYGLEDQVKERTRKLWLVINQLREEINYRERVEIALRKSEAETRSLASLLAEAQKVAHVGCWEFDVSTHLVTWSDELFRILGLNPGEIEPSFAEYLQKVHPEDLKNVKKSVKRVVNEGKPYEFDQRIICPDGEIRYLAAKGQPICDQKGKIVKLFGTILDITERKIVEENLRKSEALLREKAGQLEETLQVLKQTQGQLIQTEKMSSLGQLVAGLAHEINNPVNFIYGNLTYAGEYIADLQKLVRLYQEYYPDPVGPVRAYIDTIDLDFLMQDLPRLFSSMQVGAERIRHIVISLRNFSRLDEAEMKRVNIHSGIESTLMILQHRLKEKGNRGAIEVLQEFGELPTVECYPAQLNQVFMNILSNAIDAVESHHGLRKIAIYTELLRGDSQQLSVFGKKSYRDNRDWVLIRIQDSGSGISSEILEKIFDPFFTTKPVGKGTGLGLSICYQIVEKHGGKILVNSQVGMGSEFTILVPVRQQVAEEVAAA